jgi:broad specificity phosphatase PhoE
VGTLYLIRHGQASYGEVDYDRLSTRGEAQARALGAFLATAKLDATYAGPHRRQQQTIALAREAAGTGVPEPALLPELAEYPAFEMLTHLMPKLVAEDPRFAQLATSPTPRLLDDAFHAVLGKWSRDEWQIDEVERVGVFVERVRSGLDRVIRAAGSGARIACVTSAGPIGVALGLALGLPRERPDRMIRTSVVVRNTSVSELRFRSQNFDWQPDQLSVVTFNVTAHLPPDLNTDR